jgi:hypothetical protein
VPETAGDTGFLAQAGELVRENVQENKWISLSAWLIRDFAVIIFDSET